MICDKSKSEHFSLVMGKKKLLNVCTGFLFDFASYHFAVSNGKSFKHCCGLGDVLLHVGLYREQNDKL